MELNDLIKEFNTKMKEFGIEGYGDAMEVAADHNTPDELAAWIIEDFIPRWEEAEPAY
jgi:hypothetical protein